MIWKKYLKNFLLDGSRALLSCSGVAPANAALLTLRTLVHAENTLVAALPDAPAAAALAESLTELMRIAEMDFKCLVVPECGRGKLLFPGGEAGRARALNRILNERFDLICGSVHALLGSAPPPEESAEGQLELHCGMVLPISELLDRLVKLDYDDEIAVSVSGEFSRRGGIVDVFSPAHDEPCRIEFFGDEIDSMRFFAPDSQRSVRKAESYRIINRAGITASGIAASDAFAYLEKLPGFRLLNIYPDAGREILEKYSVPGAPERWKKLSDQHEAIAFFDSPASPEAALLPIADVSPLFSADSEAPQPDEERAVKRKSALELELLRRRIADFAGSSGDGAVVVLGKTAEDLPALRAWCKQKRLLPAKAEFDCASMTQAFTLDSPPLLVLPENQLAAAGFRRIGADEDEAEETENAVPVSPADRKLPEMPDLSLTDFDEGDYVVHLDYGIAIYRGIRIQDSEGEKRELLTLEYRDGKLLFVPLTQAYKISRYLGSPGRVKLHALGGNRWNTEKSGVRQGVRSYAADMLRFQAVRQAVPGLPLTCSASEFRAFLRAFPFKDTECQTKATAEIAADMAQKKPMDRLLCGDVGYGKTEIAMRAAFRAVSAGYQVAVIAPTTVLAQQHFRSFTERFREYPVVIDVVSRFRTQKEQHEIAEKLQRGSIDILIGTSRLCGGTFKFRNLGLAVIDEEQRFGVDQKERLRRFRVEADVLSMSATPIPRTLYLAMAGARDLSTLLTPPKLRLPVRTVIAPLEDALISGAIKAELARGGQVYYLYNRVATIEERAAKLRELLPGARIGVAHGQMPEHQLSEVMSGFLDGKVDVLVCSTIIESGLDVPNANTMLIERADRFGLAELYQLRGRVGRWKQQAYAYMLLPKNQLVGTAARKRLAAIRRCSTLGAGFQLALRDLEIRGAGNLLGSEQSGHLNLIGFDLYCRLLKQEIAQLKGEKEEILEEPEITLDFLRPALSAPPGVAAAAFPLDYIENERLRISAYRKLAGITRQSELAEFAEELADRFGRLPEASVLLLDLNAIRIAAARAGYRTLRVADGIVSISNPGGTVYRQNGKIPRLDPRDPVRLRLRQLLHLFASMPVKFPESEVKDE